MSSQPSLFAIADELVRGRQPFAWCTVVGALRSTPRDAGARMLVRHDGGIVGTVGGGPLEATVISEALALMNQPEGPSTHLVEASLTTEGEIHLGMKCGGEVKVLVDVHRPAARVVVMGAGHVGLEVASVARTAGWDVVVADDRPDRLALVPDGCARRGYASDAVREALVDVGASDFIVILTRCHEIDEGALEAALGTSARYIGLIGSRRKVAVIFRNLRQKGLPDPSRDERVYAPIGLALGGKAPGEIAVSVVAELLAVRDGLPAPHRRLPPRPVRLLEEASDLAAVASK